MKQISKEELLKSLDGATKKSTVYENLGFSSVLNSRTIKRVKTLYSEIGIDLDKALEDNRTGHADCPVCGNRFSFPTCKPKSTCSYACSNTYFRSGINNGSHKRAKSGGTYRTICFHHHEKKCIVCGEEKIVHVHHNDHDNSNNDPENLIPLCPTHHQYVHSRYKDEVQPIIDDYIGSWKQ